MKATALRPLAERRHHAFDRLQAFHLLADVRDAPHQPFGVGMQGALEQAVRLGLLDHPAGVHHQHPFGEIGDHAEVVGYDDDRHASVGLDRSEEHTSELQSLMRISYAVFCLKKKKKKHKSYTHIASTN